MNKVIINGTIGRQITLNKTNSGKSYAFISLGTKGYGKDKTDWIDCIAWDKTAEALAKRTNVGDTILAEGKIAVSEYERDGKKFRQLKVNILHYDMEKLGKVSREKIAAAQAAKANAVHADEVFCEDAEIVSYEEAELPF